MSFGQTKARVMLVLLMLLHAPLAKAAWQKLSTGLEYQKLNNGTPTPWSALHAFKLDLRALEMNLVTAQELDLSHASIKDFSKTKHAYISINGGFFDHNFKPLGLRIQKGAQKSPLKAISWWGIFYIKGNKAHISDRHSFEEDPDIDFALQSGPRLLINGKIPKLKPGHAERSALCIRKDGKVIIAVTDNQALLTQELAEALKAPPLNCIDALNLDGGSSSQLHAHVDTFILNVYGFSKISDAILVNPR